MAIDSVTKFFGKGKENNAPDQVVNLSLDILKPNPFQPRKQFDTIQMEELCRSIAEMGVIQPIVVRHSGNTYEIVAGERRWRAAKMAGQTSIRSIIMDFSDREMAEIALVENLQRADLNYFEEAEGYRKLIEDFHVTQEELASRVGKSQPTIANKLRLLKIDPFVKDQIMVELLTERHVRALLKMKTPEEQLAILKEVYEKDLNVKDTEYLINEYLEGRVSIDGEQENEDEGEGEGEDGAGKKQNIRRAFSDMRIYINTIKAAVNTVIDAGVDAKIDQIETDESIMLTITIPRLRK